MPGTCGARHLSSLDGDGGPDALEDELAVAARRRGSCRPRRSRPRAAAARAGSRAAAGSRASADGRRRPGPTPRRRSPASRRRSARSRGPRSASRVRSRSSWRSTISPICSRVSGSNSTISSIRFRNSGRKCSRIDSALRMFEVMISTALRKSTVRPWPSVSRPSSSTCSSTSKTSVCAFSISSSSTTAVRPAAHGLRQLAALVVADVAGRRADQARHRVPLLVLAHVDPDHRLLVVEHELGERACELGLADTGRAEEDERADRPVGILQPGARAPQRVRDGGRPPRPGRRRARAVAPRGGSASRSRSRGAGRRGCRSSGRRRTRCRPRRPPPSPSWCPRRRPRAPAAPARARGSRCSGSRSTRW